MLAPQSQRRPGYTLMEMLLVMALIVMIASISVPVMQTMMADAGATAAGDILRGRMAEARARAMDEGRPWRVGFISGSRIYQIAPDDSTEWAQPSQDTTETADVIRDQLPEKIYFGLSREVIQTGADPPTAGANWETAAVFLPDGSARDDTFTYFGTPGIAPMRIRLRSLIGAITVEAVQPQAVQP